MSETNPANPDPIEAILDACLERSSAGWAAAVDQACREHPTHAAELRRRFEYLRAAGMITPAPDPEVAMPAAPAPGAEADAIGMGHFGGYERLEVLGRGGMGVVYLAQQTSTGREVALKVIRPELLHLEKARQRFRREIEAVASLDDPGICTVYDAGEVDGVPYVAMRYVEGVTLGDLIRTSPDAEDGAATTAGLTTGAQSTRDAVAATVQMFEKVARALHTAHESGVLHRDIKPANIMVDTLGEPVIVDFGLARLADEEGNENLTLSGDQLGTPAFMSPEQVSPSLGRLDRRADIYALAISLYQTLAGAHPFESTTREQLYARILAGDAPSLRKQNRHVSKDLQTVIAMAMDVSADRRYQSAADFADDLRRARTFEPIRARRASAPMRALRWIRREPLRAALIVALVAGAGLVGFLISEQKVREVGRRALQTARLERLLSTAIAQGAHGGEVEALDKFDAILSESPGHPEALAGKAMTLHDLKRDAEALAVIEDSGQSAATPLRVAILRGLDRGDEADAIEAGLEPPANSVAFFVAGLLSSRRAHHVPDPSAFEETYALWTNAILHSKSVRRIHLTELLHCARHMDDRDKMQEAIRALRSNWPDEVETWHAIAEGLSALDPLDGIENCERILKVEPEHGPTWIAKANALYNLRRFDEAHDAYAVAVRLVPDHYDAAVRQARCMERMGRVEEALETFAKLGRRFPTIANIPRQAAYLHLDAERYDLAIPLVRKAIAIGRGQAIDHVNLIQALSYSGQTKEAGEAAQAAVQLHPDDHRILAVYGRTLLAKGRAADAVAPLERANELGPPTAFFMKLLADAYEQCERPEDALAQFEAAYRLAPQIESLKRNIDRLRSALQK